VRQIRRPTPRQVGPVAIATLALSAAAPAAAAVKLTVGQELLYTGTVAWKMAQEGTPAQSFTGPLQLSAVVTASDPALGYALLVMRRFQPDQRPDQPGAPPEATVGTIRYDSSLIPTRPRPTFVGGPLAEISPALATPLTPQADLKTGLQWTRKQTIPLLSQTPVEVTGTVGAETKVGARAALPIVKKLAASLPYQQPFGTATLLLTDYGQTIKVDPATGVVLEEEIHGRVQLTSGQRKMNGEYRATLALTETRQLSDTERASRIRQAEAIDRVHQSLLATGGSLNKQRVQETGSQIAAFRQEFPSSPYASVLEPISEMLKQLGSQIDRTERHQKLAGSPAPAFALKDLTGKQQTLAAHRGKIVVLNFFASWCPPCHAEAPHMEKEFWQKYRNRGVLVLGVNAGERGPQTELARQFSKKHGLTFPVLIDAGDKVASQYGVVGYPTTIVIDRQGTVRMVDTGFNPAKLEETITSLLQSK
jgi:peroxiredoxin